MTSATSKHLVVVLGHDSDCYGAPSVLLQVVDVLQSSNYEPIVFLPRRGPLTESLASRGVRHHVLTDFALRRTIATPRRLLAFMWANWVLLRAVRRATQGRELFGVYSNTLAVPVGPWIARSLGTQHFWHLHEVLPASKITTTLISKYVRRLSSVVITPSIRCAEPILRADDRSCAVAVVPNCIDRELASFSSPRRMVSGSVRVGLVARIHPGKGHPVMIEAMRLIQAQALDVELHCFGDPAPGYDWYLSEVVALCHARGVDGSVTFHGFVSERACIYAQLDLVVVPSSVPESFSLSCLEAQAMGLPVVAAAVGGPSEIVVDGITGLLVVDGSASGYAQAIGDIASDEDTMRAMGLRARELAHQRFGPERFSLLLQRAIGLHDGVSG